MEKAIDDGNIPEITKLLDSGTLTPRDGLVYAVLNYGYDEPIALFISRGADPNEPFDNTYGSTTFLQYAVQKQDIALVFNLLENGANPNKVSDEEHSPPLIMACFANDNEIAEVLLEKGADPNIEDSESGNTPLIQATNEGNSGMITLLIDKGADPNKENSKTGETPLLVTCKYADDEDTLYAAEILLHKGADPNKTNPKTGYTPLLFVTSNSSKSQDMVQILLNNGADPNKAHPVSGLTPIHSAISRKNEESVRLLLEKGADPNIVLTVNGSTPLMYALSVRNLPREIVELLLEKGADPNKENPKIKDTPLIFTVFHEMVWAVKLLLEKGADPNKINPDTGTVPVIAAASRTDIQILKLLVEKGADVNKENLNTGTTALISATNFKNIENIKLLLEKGADPNKVNKDGKKAIDFATTDEIRDLLSGIKPAPPAPYSGKSKSDIDFFNIFLGTVDESTTEEEMKNMIKNTAFCPVCLANTIRIDGCLYMHHICEKSARNEALYNKYKSEDTGEIWWCVDCCRICAGHRHYKIGIASDAKPDLQPAGAVFAKACDGSDGSKSNGGGSTTEKLKRIARMIDYAFELQHFVGEITEKEAKDELIEEVWNSAIMRLRFDPLKFKRWKTDLSVFKEVTSTASVVPEAVPASGDIDTPTVDNGTDFISLDEGIVIQFKHKNKDGVMFNHIHGDNDMRFIGKNSLITFMKTMGEKLGKCFDDDCGGWLWPQEIEMAFNDPKLKDSVTEEDRKALAAYKERFNAAKAPKTGGGSAWKFNFFSEMEDGQCYLPKKKAGNRTRKNRKITKKTRHQK